MDAAGGHGVLGISAVPGRGPARERQSPRHDAGDEQRGHDDHGGIVVARDDVGGELGRGAIQDDRGGGEEIVGNGSNVAACQDIGALPAGLDGIIGLSLLGRYDRVDFDYANGELRLSSNREIDDDDDDPRDVPNGDGDASVVVARCALRLTRLRVYAADVTLDGRGPVGMLVDTGASSTFLNRRGVSDMRLSMHSPPLIEPIRGEAIGAMGADNLALRLTHRYRLRRRWNLVAENTSLGGLGLAGVEMRGGGGEGDGRNIDIGDLPVLEALGGDGVGGILGADLLMMCDVVRFSGLNTGSPTMILMQR